MRDSTDKIKVLVTVFACSPDHGSEPGIGWGWVRALSSVCRLTVLTTTCNREGIERFQEGENAISAKFVYEDVSNLSQRLNEKAKHKIGVLIRLLLWQHRIKKKIAILTGKTKYQIIHHITLGSFRMPFSVTGHGVRSIVGPVGGCEVFPVHLLPDQQHRIQLRERIRNLATWVHEKHGIAMKRYHKPNLTISCTKEMSLMFKKWGVDSPVFPNIGMHHDQVKSQSKKYLIPSEGKQLKLLFVGNLLYWKGLELAILALKELPESITLCCVGSGSDRYPLESLIKRCGLEKRVEFKGQIDRDLLLKMYSTYDVFCFPSLHDSGGMAVIEAMRAGLPVICLDAGGPSISVNSTCGRIVPMGSKREIIKSLRSAFMYYANNRSMIEAHGKQARLRVIENYDWSKNAVRMVSLYQSVLNKPIDK